jgi:Zn-dependent peptidase ImmA (M78 family)
MAKSLDARIIEDRRIKQNPYAHLNEHGGYSALPPMSAHLEDASPEQIRQSRLLLADPYAHLDESGDFSALTNQTAIQDSGSTVTQSATISLQEINPIPKDHYSDDELELIARNLQAKLWRERNKIWPGSALSNPIKILDPEVALKAVGYHFELAETLGQIPHQGKQIEVAGTIDKNSKHVRISRRFSPFIRSFTAAHELGHALLHKASGLHRDKPIDGTSLSRSSVEIQADKFATYFLMPQKQVRNIFKQLFLADNFMLNEATAFALGCDYETLEKKTLRELSKTLASAQRFNRVNFVSMADQFQVSIEAMAIRLEELGLIQEYSLADHPFPLCHAKQE